MFYVNDAVPLETVGDKIRRRVLPPGDALMMVEVHFEAGGVGAPHSHDIHEQVSRILKGSFEVRLGDETRTLRAGEGFVARCGVVHGVVALEDSVILDIFNPIREDFIKPGR